MNENDLQTYSQIWNDGKLSNQEFLEKLTLYIIHNKNLLGLQKHDEDFMQDLLLKVLETGEKFLNSYNPNIGPFENYFKAYLSTLIHSKKKALVKKIIESKVFDEESINNYSEKIERYELLELPPEFKPKAPYSFTPIEKTDFDTIFKLKPNKKDKRLLVLALKASFYITDFQIENLCKFYELNPKDFLNSIQYCKASITDKSKRREMFIERRNKAYCYHKKYEKQLNFLKEKDFNKFKLIVLHSNANISDKMVKVLKLYKNNLKYIENSFKYDINNGIIEGTNNLIKCLKRIAFGYRKYDHFIARIFLIQGIIKE